jgi:hypothetical protein
VDFIEFEIAVRKIAEAALVAAFRSPEAKPFLESLPNLERAYTVIESLRASLSARRLLIPTF